MPSKSEIRDSTAGTARRRFLAPGLQSASSVSSNERIYHRSIGQTLEVLNCFDGKAPLALRAIGARTGLAESTLFRVLFTLKRRGYLVQALDGTYQLAPKLRFGWLTEQGNVLRAKVRPELERLLYRFSESASLDFLYEDRIQVLDSIESSHQIRMSSHVGRVLPPHCSAGGKAITAFQEHELANRILDVYGLSPCTVLSTVERRQLFREFEEIRTTGIARDREEWTLGGICFAAAIRPADKPVTAAINISAPIARMTSQREKEMRRAVLEASSRAAGA